MHVSFLSLNPCVFSYNYVSLLRLRIYICVFSKPVTYFIRTPSSFFKHLRLTRWLKKHFYVKIRLACHFLSLLTSPWAFPVTHSGYNVFLKNFHFQPVLIQSLFLPSIYWVISFLAASKSNRIHLLLNSAPFIRPGYLNLLSPTKCLPRSAFLNPSPPVRHLLLPHIIFHCHYLWMLSLANELLRIRLISFLREPFELANPFLSFNSIIQLLTERNFRRDRNISIECRCGAYSVILLYFTLFHVLAD